MEGFTISDLFKKVELSDKEKKRHECRLGNRVSVYFRNRHKMSPLKIYKKNLKVNYYPKSFIDEARTLFSKYAREFELPIRKRKRIKK